MSETRSVSRMVLAVGIIALILNAANIIHLFQLSGQVSNLAKQVEVVVGNQKVILQEPHVSAFMAAYKEKGDIVVQAQKEGKVMFYTAYATDKGISLLEAFKKKYPFIETGFYRMGSVALFERYQLEYKAGQYLADVVLCDEPRIIMFKKAGYLAKATPDLPEAKIVPGQLKDKEGYYVARDILLHAPMVNTKLLPDNALWPKDWTDFADPKPQWIGKLGVADPRVMGSGHAVAYGIRYHFGNEKYVSVMKGLVKAKPVLQTSSAGIVTQSLAGETPIVLFSLDYNYLIEKMKGAPLEWLLMKSGSIAITMNVAVLVKASHPNAARLFADFALSKESVEMHIRSGDIVYSPRPDVKSLAIVPTLEQHNPIYLVSDVADNMAKEQEAFLTEWLQLMGSSS